jgi:hypothetical protein
MIRNTVAELYGNAAGMACDRQCYAGRLKTRQSKLPIPVPEHVRPVIEAWRSICNDTSPEALTFLTFGHGKRKGQAVLQMPKSDSCPNMSDKGDTTIGASGAVDR